MQGAGGRELAALPNGLYWLLFKASGIHEMALRFADPAALSIPDTVARSQYIGSYGFIQVAMGGTQLVGLRRRPPVLSRSPPLRRRLDVKR
jgi:hypothetical protein